MRRRFLSLALLQIGFSACAFATPCFAEPRPLSVLEPPRSFEAWYGAWILPPSAIADLGAAFIIAKAPREVSDGNEFEIKAAQLSSMKTSVVLAIGASLIAPTIHWVHGHGRRGFASLGIHVAMSLSFALAGYASTVDECNTGSCITRFARASIGMLLGGGAATILDTTLLAYDEPRESKRSRSAPKGMPWTLSLAPSVTPNSLGLSVMGRL